jgi:primosomal protein N' (replication factor Y)
MKLLKSAGIRGYIAKANRKFQLRAKHNTGNLFGEDESPAASDGPVVRIAFDSGADSVFDYIAPDFLGDVYVGQRVLVPFGRRNKLATGFCVEVIKAGQEEKARAFKLKSVKKIIDEKPLLDAHLIALAEWISGYYVCPLGQVLAAMVPAAVKKGIGTTTQKFVYLAKEDKTKLSSTRQKEIVEVLKQMKAFDADTAVSQADVMTRASVATAGPFGNLAGKGIIKIFGKQYYKSPPVIPGGLRPAGGKIVLNENQRIALEKIDAAITGSRFGVTLLHGVTDSGKTELYMRAIQTVLKQKKTAIVMLPEIALTAQTTERFSSRLANIAVMHCQLTAAQRNSQWQKIKAGQADVVIGARSAVFAPLNNIGLIIVDEEHEPAYKQDTAPRYHGRDVAIKRAQLLGAHCLLGSATPSLETILNCRSKKHYTRICLPERVMNLPMPQMKLVDISSSLTKNGINLISEQLLERLKEALAKSEQAILLLNRRGYSNFIFCPSCGHSLSCRNCDVTLTFHKRPGPKSSKNTVTSPHFHSGYAICHYCLSKTLVPQKCPLCSKNMTMIGLGSQRLAEELTKKLPAAKVARIDSDSMRGKDYYELLAKFAKGRIDILAGTQMLAKGLHFPNVTVVGVVSADTSLTLPDFRANERTFQLISQVAGRAGRSEKTGTVIVQTLLPKQPVIQMALKHDYDAFVKAELAIRKKCHLPPYWSMASITLRDTKYDRLTAASDSMKNMIDGIIAAGKLDIAIRGPMPAIISRIQRYHRNRIIIQAASAKPIQALFAVLRASAPIRPAVKVSFDMDPINLL